MRRAVLAVVLLLVASGIVLAATYTVTTTAAQEVRLTRGRLAWNAANPGDTDATNELFFRRLCVAGYQTVVNNQDQDDAITACATFRAASAAAKNNACAAVGLAAGCNLCP